MTRIAYRFIPSGEDGHPSNTSQFTLIRDEAEEIDAGSVIAANLLGFSEWAVLEVRRHSGFLEVATDADGTSIPLGGTLICRGVRRD